MIYELRMLSKKEKKRFRARRERWKERRRKGDKRRIFQFFFFFNPDAESVWYGCSVCVRESMSSRFLKIGKLLFTFLRIGKGKSVNLHFKQSLKFIRVFHVICRKTVEREREMRWSSFNFPFLCNKFIYSFLYLGIWKQYAGVWWVFRWDGLTSRTLLFVSFTLLVRKIGREILRVGDLGERSRLCFLKNVCFWVNFRRNV